jgi:hypothetical protein
MAFGIFAIMCPGCGKPLDNDDDGSSMQRLPADDVADERADDVPADVRVCDACASAFVVRFGHAFAVARRTDRGAL